MRYHQLSSLGCVYGLHGFRLDHSCISASCYLTSADRIIMEEVGACQPLDSHGTALFIGMEEATCFRCLPSLRDWAINVTYSMEPADSTVDSKTWVHPSNTSEVSVTMAITTLLARKKNLGGELTCPYKQILPGFLSTETIFFHHGIWNFSYMITLNNRNKSETNDSVDSDKAQWR